jgi:hypothetical protein
MLVQTKVWVGSVGLNKDYVSKLPASWGVKKYFPKGIDVLPKTYFQVQRIIDSCTEQGSLDHSCAELRIGPDDHLQMITFRLFSIHCVRCPLCPLSIVPVVHCARCPLCPLPDGGFLTLQYSYCTALHTHTVSVLHTHTVSVLHTHTVSALHTHTVSALHTHTVSVLHTHTVSALHSHRSWRQAPLSCYAAGNTPSTAPSMHSMHYAICTMLIHFHTLSISEGTATVLIHFHTLSISEGTVTVLIHYPYLKVLSLCSYTIHI